MRTLGVFYRMIGIAPSVICILVTIALVSAKSEDNDQDLTAVSGKVTGNVQKVGFRAMIQRQAIRYNLAGSAENDSDGSVKFTL
jgi:Acylphosphatase